MDPFALQHEARKRIPWLIALIVLAVAATAAAMGFVLWGVCWSVWSWAVSDFAHHAPKGPMLFAEKFPLVVVACFVVSALAVIGGLLYKIFDLTSGDQLMAQIGAKRIVRARLSETDDADVSRLRFYNICEEMAIASGLDMPSVWVMESVAGINALAAGSDPSAAAVCVTAGALRYLTRDELQGVIAHEFSHILNGDMRLNFRLTALIAGISMVSRTGKGMFGVLTGGSDSETWITNGKKGGLPLPLPLLVIYVLSGIALCLIGSAGEFFARLVQGAVSRNREYLADASAAQFTRNPEGLANALRLTYLADAATVARSYGAWRADVSHMMFASSGFDVVSTHPPVVERIRRLSPRGIGADETLKRRIRDVRDERRRKAKEVEENFRKNSSRVIATNCAMQSFLASKLPVELMSATRDVTTAGALLKELLGEPGPYGVKKYPVPVRRTLAFRCVITLRDGLTVAERRQWADTVWNIATRDGEFDSFEIVVCASVRRHLLTLSPPQLVPGVKLMPTAAAVIATVASFGRNPSAGYQAAVKRLSLFGKAIPSMPPPINDAEEFLAALEKLSCLSSLAKKELLFALRDAAAEDGVMRPEETDYIAAVADAIGAYGWLQMQSAQQISKQYGLERCRRKLMSVRV